MEKKTFLIKCGYDGDFNCIHGVLTCTEQQAADYCKRLHAEEEMDAYSVDEDDPMYDPYPYIMNYSYQEVEVLSL